MEVKVCLSGFGNVGRHFARLVSERAPEISKKYGFELSLRAVAELNGGVLSSGPIDISELLRCWEAGAIWSYPEAGTTASKGVEIIRQCEADVLVEATPTNIVDGEPGISHFRTAMQRGMHVVTLSKGPMVVAFREMMEVAKHNAVSLRYSGATAAALPAFDVASHCLAGSSITLFEGILNGTTNYVLDQMASRKITYKEALGEAQQLGVAEPDPTLDVSGWDTACKTIILANSIFGSDIKPDDLNVEGITHLLPEDVDRALARGNVLKLIGRAAIEGGELKVSVAPQQISEEHMFAAVRGTTKAVRFESDTMGELVVMGGKSDPRAAAAAALKDVINIFRK